MVLTAMFLEFLVPLYETGIRFLVLLSAGVLLSFATLLITFVLALVVLRDCLLFESYDFRLA